MNYLVHEKKASGKNSLRTIYRKESNKASFSEGPILEKSDVNIHEKRTKNSITSDLFTRFFPILKEK